LGIAAVSLHASTAVPVSPGSSAHRIDRPCDHSIMSSGSLDRYLTNKPKDPKFWKIANWFGTANN
jgi:hypothetical protein